MDMHEFPKQDEGLESGRVCVRWEAGGRGGVWHLAGGTIEDGVPQRVLIGGSKERVDCFDVVLCTSPSIPDLAQRVHRAGPGRPSL